ncbi:MAG: DUF4351 domain-containing protein [Acidobacteria bacterium]|nr:DUF4351 domain-containing protein [Acidobacteriota bacterium]
MSDLKLKLPKILDTVVEQVLPKRAAELLTSMVRYVHDAGRLTEKELIAAVAKSKKSGKYMDSIWIELFPAKLEMVAEEVEQKTGAMLTLRQLKQKLGKLTESAEARIRELSFAELQQLSDDLLKFETRSDLTAWLHRHAPKKKSASATAQQS